MEQLTDHQLQFGIVQGRLSHAPPKMLQWFPQNVWREEFSIAAQIGIHFIELIAEEVHNPDNPLWSDEGVAELKSIVHKNELTLHAFCNDYVIRHDLRQAGSAWEQTLSLLERGKMLGCTMYILPLMGVSELTEDNSQSFIDPLRSIADIAMKSSITICLETNVEGAVLYQFMKDVDHEGVGLVFDTGNRVANGHDLTHDIKLLNSYISHIHIKDKTAENKSVFLGTGNVNFFDVFKALADINYLGAYTIETIRGRNPARTAQFNMDFVNFFHSEGYVDAT